MHGGCDELRAPGVSSATDPGHALVGWVVGWLAGWLAGWQINFCWCAALIWDSVLDNYFGFAMPAEAFGAQCLVTVMITGAT